MKKVIALILLLAIILGGIVMTDVKGLNAHEDELQAVADTAALTLAIGMNDSENSAENFKISVTEIRQELAQEDIHLDAEWMKAKQRVKVTAGRPFKGLIIRKKNLLMEASVDAVE